jgi:hypothetical protein
MRRYVLPVVRKAGLSGINWHSFRHSFTVQQRRQGTRPEGSVRSSRDASVATAMDAYDHASEKRTPQPINQLLQDVMKTELVA